MTDLEIETDEGFEIEFSALIERYLDLGLSRRCVEEITYTAIEDMFNTKEYVDGE